MARCYNCGQVFDAFANATDGRPPGLTEPDQPPQPDPELDILSDDELDLDDLDAIGDLNDADLQLPFEVPSDLPPLQASSEAALDVADTLAPRRAAPSPWWQKLLLLLLLLALLAQLTWWQRSRLPQYPLLAPLCQWIDCGRAPRRAPAAFEVIERGLQVAPGQRGALQLTLRVRNGADFAQPLPRLSLSLLDSNGVLLARRLLAPADYLFPAPRPDRLLAAQEVITIDLLFEDPGARATGFTLDFL